MPHGAAGGAGDPTAASTAACRAHGPRPSVHTNRTHVVPARDPADAEAKEGLAALGAAPAAADGHTG